MGRHDEAIATAELALKRARATGEDAMAARIETDLATYRAILASAASAPNSNAASETPSN
jgi:hypothetical protein